MAIERQEGGRGQWQQRVEGSPTWKQEHPCGGQIKGRAPIQNCPGHGQELHSDSEDNAFQTAQTSASSPSLIPEHGTPFSNNVPLVLFKCGTIAFTDAAL